VKLRYRWVYTASCKMNQLEHPANVGKDVSEPSYLDEMLCIA